MTPDETRRRIEATINKVINLYENRRDVNRPIDQEPLPEMTIAEATTALLALMDEVSREARIDELDKQLEYNGDSISGDFPIDLIVNRLAELKKEHQ